MSTTTITRRNSLRIPAQPPPIPVPPSLRQSPYLNAALFKYDLYSPNDEDERWLQDTVPLTQGGRVNTKGSVDRRAKIVSSQPVDSGRDTTLPLTADGAVIPPPPLSPPIIHWRATRPDYLVQSHSEPNITSNTRT